ncbi:methyltransferase domain-containing protein [Paenibacillus donghaensis]|uniref:methyltransferase domain-containing protein n=1 Tax=Paenibacillus donghaensis TaxID=414771 RepID=UPI0012F765C3|nr:methyltransferase domain-containing protein [Paenibacillus donghaensis]
MSTVNAFSASWEQYLHYTTMPWGRLFYQTAWRQIDDFLTLTGQSLLDIGCGFGISSNEYSRRGNRVTGIEPTPEMLAIAEAGGEKVSYIKDSFEQTAHLLGLYDWILCHNVLEYSADPQLVISYIRECQQPGGYLSLIAHNPVAKVMKQAIILKDPERALANMGSSQEYSGIIQTDITVYSYEQLTEWLHEAGYEIAEHYGIHNLYGYIADNELKQDEEWHKQVTELEMEAGKQSPYRDIAVFTHIIARKRS